MWAGLEAEASASLGEVHKEDDGVIGSWVAWWLHLLGRSGALWLSSRTFQINSDSPPDLLTWKLNEMVSMEMTDFLAKFCSVPVRKAWGKKNPLIQNTEGIPWLIQFCRNSIRCTKSFTHDANGFRDG